MFEMARPSLPFSPALRGRGGAGGSGAGTAAHWTRPANCAPSSRALGQLGRPARPVSLSRGARCRGLRDTIVGRRQPRPPPGRPPGAARNLDILTCLKLFINSPGGALLWLRLRPRLLRPGGLAPRRGAHAKQINMPWLTQALHAADRVSASPCGN
jgi:hypothetical protein